MRTLRSDVRAISRRSVTRFASAAATPPVAPNQPPSQLLTPEEQVLAKLRNVIDPDFGEDIVACGFVRQLEVDASVGFVSFTLELTTPACPVKEMFQRQSTQFVKELPWVRDVSIKLTAQPPKPLLPESGRPGGLAKMGAKLHAHVFVSRVGIFDADVYGPSLPLMVNPEIKVLEMDPATKAIFPTEYEGVKVVSFGFAGQGSAIMRGPMVSGLIQQMLTTAAWGELDYLVVDFPPGTGDIQLTLCQTVSFSAAVIVTTPQKLAFIDVAKGIRMFAKLVVPCVAVVENMSYFEADGKRFFPFGQGSGERIQRDFGLPNLVRFPIVPDLSAAGDGGQPLVVADPTSATAAAFMDLGAAVVREVAKMAGRPARQAVYYDPQKDVISVQLPGETEFLLPPVVVRENDTSATSIDEWTGQRKRDEVPQDARPAAINPLGNYAVQISWSDGFNQVASYELLDELRRYAVPCQGPVAITLPGGLTAEAQL
ncbi:hypothetical protein VOLCADRAFT_107985 [Volvox carteri f. nagariensis]|uniref:MIP18 family-like domain-containing protein n=1 Tax=Volvox carteri f. nagariensis TaxID=3068 RepID=D8UHL0_VOLCA|nr:uncharacterized protein VOLCADRAFT_107985 [Volvox carteri f. nagariensis]EFJ40792.1 hypothetical protein VOLCADRAFT_107985 [Volvox carteri f. nagariensis]|eukprot:XP_002958167.1 hypothetical protein VOLCADRAFT_107985 [Volvox carteri f. nagariensis]